MNAFMVWSSVERKKLAEEEPRLHNTELSKRLGLMWKKMTENEKLPFRREADKLKAKLMEDYPDYKYKPRRRKIDVASKNAFFGNMKALSHGVHASVESEHHDYQNHLSIIKANASRTSSYSLLSPTSRSPYNIHPVQDSSGYYYPSKKTISSINGQLQSTNGHLQSYACLETSYHMPSFYASPTTALGIYPFQYSNTQGYGYKINSTGYESPSIQVIHPFDTNNYDREVVSAVSTPGSSDRKDFGSPDQMRYESSENPAIYPFPCLETPPCSPYISSPSLSETNNSYIPSHHYELSSITAEQPLTVADPECTSNISSSMYAPARISAPLPPPSPLSALIPLTRETPSDYVPKSADSYSDKDTSSPHKDVKKVI